VYFETRNLINLPWLMNITYFTKIFINHTKRFHCEISTHNVLRSYSPNHPLFSPSLRPAGSPMHNLHITFMTHFFRYRFHIWVKTQIFVLFYLTCWPPVPSIFLKIKQFHWL
jgi:hypothetical protein